MKKLLGSLAMLIATLLWGTAFSAQSMGMKFLKPMVLTTLRSVVGGGGGTGGHHHCS